MYLPKCPKYISVCMCVCVITYLYFVYIIISYNIMHNLIIIKIIMCEHFNVCTSSFQYQIII